jgi:phosphoribosyl-AMP cyclohydrolase
MTAAITAERPAVARYRSWGWGPTTNQKMDYKKLDGLVPAVIQDADSGEVLMVGFMNSTALATTRETGFATFYSRSRQELWTKGETSGNKLAVQQILVDCDDDTVLVKVKRLGDGNVCHTGARTCFRELEQGAES